MKIKIKAFGFIKPKRGRRTASRPTFTPAGFILGCHNKILPGLLAQWYVPINTHLLHVTVIHKVDQNVTGKRYKMKKIIRLECFLQ